MNKEIEIISPSKKNNKLFVEYKRPFLVRGKININEKLSSNSILYIKLLDKDNNIIRYTKTKYDNQELDLFNKNLLGYPSEYDAFRIKLKEYGFPILRVDDIKNPSLSIRNATIKSSFDNQKFESLIVSATDKNNGAIFDDGMNFTDEFNNPYQLLNKGEYTLIVELHNNDHIYKVKEELIIDSNKNQLICRFNPLSHKNKMIEWAKENDYSIITDTVPGYLDSYLGIWLYHMGLIKMYHASDVALYDDTIVRAFIYSMDETSTSYKMEIPYLETKGIIENRNYFHAYHYDIGEAILGINKSYYRKANILEFKDNEFFYIPRIDIVNDKAKENIFYLDERHLINTLYDIDNINLNKDDNIMIMGIIRPYQMDKNNYILNIENNTFNRVLYPKYIKYSFFDNDLLIDEVIKEVNLIRYYEKPISGSMYEFYNLFKINKYNLDKIKVFIEIYDNKMNKTKLFTQILLNLNKLSC